MKANIYLKGGQTEAIETLTAENTRLKEQLRIFVTHYRQFVTTYCKPKCECRCCKAEALTELNKEQQ